MTIHTVAKIVAVLGGAALAELALPASWHGIISALVAGAALLTRAPKDERRL